MQIKEIMDLIKDEQLIALGKEYGVDKVNHKITGGFILKTFVRSSLLGRAISLRSMEEMVPLSGELSGLLKTKKGSVKVDHSSIGKRLQTIKPEYFKAVYEELVEQSDKYFSKKEKTILHRFDSTIINLSGRIIKDGLKIGGKDKDSQIKMSVGLKGQIPASIRFCTSRSESSEDIALVKAINEAKLDKEDILLFDRGLMKATSYEDFKRREIKFVTRVNVGRRHHVVKELSTEQQPFGNGLRVKSEALINLYNGSSKILACDFRLVIVIDAKGEELWLWTNLSEPSGVEIADMYKRRWDIEVFFKFVKQHLQFKHFISHSQNGMMVYIYSLLIAAILFTIFKVTNKLSGFKIPLLRFCLLLEKELLQDVVILSGGNWNFVKDKIWLFLPAFSNIYIFSFIMINDMFLTFDRCSLIPLLLLNLADNSYIQTSLLSNSAEEIRNSKLMKTLDSINNKMGRDSIFFASQGIKREWQMKAARRSANFTGDWNQLISVE